MLKRTLSTISLLLTLSATSEQLQLNNSLGHPMLLKGKENQTFLKIGLTGFEIKSEQERPKTNIALVIDKSGSMSGDKIVKAKEAAIEAINQLGPDDIVSVLTYSNSVDVVVPATKLTDKQSVIAKVQQINAGGGTALFAGVCKGGAEVKKFVDNNRINRVILLSDGQANVGPSSPELLGDLSLALSKENIAVTTIGLGQGYNENVMVALAQKGEGNHYYVGKSEDLAKTFNQEFGDLMSVCAKDVALKVELAEGVKCKRSLGREAKIDGSTITYSFPQVYSGQEKFLMLEISVAGDKELEEMKVADVVISYYNAQSKVTDNLSSTVNCRLIDDPAEVERIADREVVKDAVEQIAAVNMVEAIKLREAGKEEEAQAVFIFNDSFIKKNISKYKIVKLKDAEARNKQATKKSDAKEIQSYANQMVINSPIAPIVVPVDDKEDEKSKK